jgi:hypothetical protein
LQSRVEHLGLEGTFVKGSILDQFATSVNRIRADPPVDSTAIDADQKPLAFDAVDLAQHDVSNLERFRSDGFHGTKLTRFDLSNHRIASGSKLHGFSVTQFFDMKRCPTHDRAI